MRVSFLFLLSLTCIQNTSAQRNHYVQKNEEIELFVANFGVQLTANTAIDALDGNGFDFGRNLGRSVQTALINSAIDGAAAAAIELKERQLSRKAANSTRVISEPVINEYSNLPEIGPVNNPITNSPNIQPQTQAGSATSPQLQKNNNTINRLKTRASTRSRSIIIRGTDGKITIINIP